MIRQIKIKTLLQFIKKVYHNNPVYKDNKTGLLRIITRPQGKFRQFTTQEIVGAFERQTLCAACILIHHPNNPDTLMMAFFEALPNKKAAFTELLDYAVTQAKRLGVKKLVAGLDGHPDYSFGFLASHFDEMPSFGQSFNPSYYPSYFEEAGCKPWKIITFQSTLSHLAQSVARQISDIDKNLHFQYADFRTRAGYKNTMKLYNSLGNQCFTEHPFYFPRLLEEDYELFASMKPLLHNNNLLFACLNGQAVGFLLWYHDFNELVKRGKGAGLSTLLKMRILKKYPKTIKIIEIGVLPQYRNLGIIQYLLLNAYQTLIKEYPPVAHIHSGWILEANRVSKKITSKFLSDEYKKQVLFELPV